MARYYQEPIAESRVNVPRETYRRIKVTPLAGALGAEIGGVDLSREIDDETFIEIHQAHLDHLVVFFRGQDISPDVFRNFATRFGPLHVNDFVGKLEGYPDVETVAKEVSDRYVFGNDWHADVTYAAIPSLGTMLYGVEIPEYGGDTLFSNLYLAYDTLSDTMKDVVGRLKVLHSAGTIFGEEGAYNVEQYKSAQQGTANHYQENADKTNAHPLVREHPETGRRGLFLNRIFTTGIEGMREEEARPLLEFLFDHCVRPDFTCRFRWTPGSLAFWDNRCTLHYATNDYPGVRRVMHRLTIRDPHVGAVTA
jgi:taurine dioxygenase